MKSNKRLENKPKGCVFYNIAMCVHHKNMIPERVMLATSHPLRTWCVLGDEVKRCQCWTLYYNHNFGKQNKNKRKGRGLMTPRMVFLSFSFSFEFAVLIAMLSCSRIVGKREMAVAHQSVHGRASMCFQNVR